MHTDSCILRLVSSQIVQLSTDSPTTGARERELEAVVARRRRELASNGRLIEELKLDLGYNRPPKKISSASVSILYMYGYNSECTFRTLFFIHEL